MNVTQTHMHLHTMYHIDPYWNTHTHTRTRARTHTHTLTHRHGRARRRPRCGQEQAKRPRHVQPAPDKRQLRVTKKTRGDDTEVQKYPKKSLLAVCIPETWVQFSQLLDIHRSLAPNSTLITLNQEENNMRCSTKELCMEERRSTSWARRKVSLPLRRTSISSGACSRAHRCVCACTHL